MSQGKENPPPETTAQHKAERTVLYKSLFTEKTAATQKHSSASINTNKAKTTTKSITVVDTLYWSINIIS